MFHGYGLRKGYFIILESEVIIKYCGNKKYNTSKIVTFVILIIFFFLVNKSKNHKI